ncbi:MAG: PAC2 family protein, partial [Candidatus Hodarchaeota archaeon]
MKTFLIGLPEIGLVGTISAMQLIKSLDMEEVGYMKSELFPPLVIFHGGQPK